MSSSVTTCPYCGEPIPAAGRDHLFCTACGTPHHKDCWEENGGCTVFGCAAAPPDDGKISVNGSEAVNAEFPNPAPVYAGPPPPPPPPGIQTAPIVPERVDPPTFGYYNVPHPSELNLPTHARVPKNRVAFILLGIFLGVFGVHNFYAGFAGKGIAQLCVTLLSCFILSPLSFIWAIVEVCIIDRDANGLPMT